MKLGEQNCLKIIDSYANGKIETLQPWLAIYLMVIQLKKKQYLSSLNTHGDVSA